MGFSNGPKSFLITSANIDSVNITGGTILSSGDTALGYEVQFRHDLGGCGGPDSGIFVKLNDSISWNNISWTWLGIGSASCWSFNVGGYGAAADPAGGGTGNLLSYNPNAGDVIEVPYLSWENPQFQSHDRTSACDNDANNFMLYNTSNYRSFVMKRRRDSMGSLAGIHHGRSCNSTGSGSITIIRGIRIWKI
jgi:hypothetical protein